MSRGKEETMQGPRTESGAAQVSAVGAAPSGIIKGHVAVPGADDDGYALFIDRLNGHGAIEVTPEESNNRYQVPKSFLDPEIGFADFLGEWWLLARGLGRKLVTLPKRFRHHYEAWAYSKIVVGQGVSEDSFRLLYINTARLLRADDHPRWRIHASLYGYLKMPADQYEVVLLPVPSEGFIEIMPSGLYVALRGRAEDELNGCAGPARPDRPK